MKLKLLTEFDKKEAGTVLDIEDETVAKGLIDSGIAEEFKEDDETELQKALAEAIAKGVKAELAIQAKALAKGSKNPLPYGTQVHDNYEDDPRGACKNIGALAKEAILYSTRGIISENLKKVLAYTSAKAINLSDTNNESIGADGGILVPDEVAAEIMKNGMVNAELNLMPQTDSRTVSGNSMTYPILDNADQSAASTRHGGIQVFWTEEAGAKTKSNLKFSQGSTMLKKLVALVPVTDELLEDVVGLESEINAGAGAALIDVTNQAIIAGDGVGKPTGIIGHSGTVSSPTDADRTTGAPITTSGITGMYDRLVNKANAVWLINQELRSAISELQVGNHAVMSAANLSGAPFQFILGIPISWTDICKAPATEGDIILANMKGYKTISKGGIRSAVSIHFYFDQNITAFRFEIRLNGQPTFKDTITPLNGAEKLSNFITLNTTA